MKKLLLLFSLLAVIFWVSLVLPGCTSSNPTPTASSPLKVGALSMMTVLPLQVAQQEGLFQSQGLNVDIVPFRSQLDRDTAFHAGQLDIIIEDIYSAPIFNKDGDTVKIVAVSPVESYMFAIVASGQSNLKTVADLKNVEIASSLGNIIEYVTDRLCSIGGLSPAEIKKSSVASMPLRLEMLNQGKITAATFSRPLSDMAVLGNGRVICDDQQKSLLASSIMVSSVTLKARPAEIRKFLAAWSQATQNISSNPAGYRSLLVNVASVSAEIADKIEVPRFDKPRLPTQDEYRSKMEWNLEKGNITQNIPYQDIVSTGFLP